MIYLDNAATTLKKPWSVYPAVFFNSIKYSANSGRGGHDYSIKTSSKIYETLESLCTLFNIKNPEDIAFTQNATYALNLAIYGILDANSHAIITQMEHNSVLRPVHKMCKYTMVKADSHGNIRVSDIKNAIKSNTKMIITTHASNVCGTILPIEEIAKLCKENNLIYLVDASQTAGSIPIDVEKIGIDILVFSGHKGLMTPMGVAGIYVNSKIKLKPIIVGGTGSLSESLIQPDFMPDILQSGTMNAPSIISAKKSIDFIIAKTPDAIGYHEKKLAIKLAEDLNSIKNVKVYQTLNSNRNGTVAFNIKDIDSVRLSQILNDEFKIATRGGWHCAYPSHIALGTEKTGTVRASFGYFNSITDEKKLVSSVIYIVNNPKFYS